MKIFGLTLVLLTLSVCQHSEAMTLADLDPEAFRHATISPAIPHEQASILGDSEWEEHTFAELMREMGASGSMERRVKLGIAMYSAESVPSEVDRVLLGMQVIQGALRSRELTDEAFMYARYWEAIGYQRQGQIQHTIEILDSIAETSRREDLNLAIAHYIVSLSEVLQALGGAENKQAFVGLAQEICAHFAEKMMGEAQRLLTSHAGGIRLSAVDDDDFVFLSEDGSCSAQTVDPLESFQTRFQDLIEAGSVSVALGIVQTSTLPRDTLGGYVLTLAGELLDLECEPESKRQKQTIASQLICHILDDSTFPEKVKKVGYEMMGYLCLQLRHMEAAIATLKIRLAMPTTSEEEGPRLVSLREQLLDLADCLLKKPGDWKDAEGIYDLVLLFPPELDGAEIGFKHAYLQLARIAMERGHQFLEDLPTYYDHAVEIYQQVDLLDPRNPDSLVQREMVSRLCEVAQGYYDNSEFESSRKIMSYCRELMVGPAKVDSTPVSAGLPVWADRGGEASPRQRHPESRATDPGVPPAEVHIQQATTILFRAEEAHDPAVRALGYRDALRHFSIAIGEDETHEAYTADALARVNLRLFKLGHQLGQIDLSAYEFPGVPPSLKSLIFYHSGIRAMTPGNLLGDELSKMAAFHFLVRAYEWRGELGDHQQMALVLALVKSCVLQENWGEEGVLKYVDVALGFPLERQHKGFVLWAKKRAILTRDEDKENLRAAYRAYVAGESDDLETWEPSLEASQGGAVSSQQVGLFWRLAGMFR